MSGFRLLHRGRRKGLLVYEVLVALLVVAAAAVAAAQLLAMVAQQRRMAQQREAAVREAGNLLETIVARPWEELTAENVGQSQLSGECRRSLPEATLHVELYPEEEESKRISIRIDWPAVTGQPGEPVRLVGWRFRDEEAKP